VTEGGSGRRGTSEASGTNGAPPDLAAPKESLSVNSSQEASVCAEPDSSVWRVRRARVSLRVGASSRHQERWAFFSDGVATSRRGSSQHVQGSGQRVAECPRERGDKSRCIRYTVGSAAQFVYGVMAEESECPTLTSGAACEASQLVARSGYYSRESRRPDRRSSIVSDDQTSVHRRAMTLSCAFAPHEAE
jgi:hypothetical protein